MVDKDLDKTSHIIPYEVVSMAMRAPSGHDLWFELKVDGMDGYSELVHPVSASRPEASTHGLERHITFSFVAYDKAGNVYSVDVHEAFPGLHGDTTFQPYMTIDRGDAAQPRRRSSTYDGERFSGATAGARGGV